MQPMTAVVRTLAGLVIVIVITCGASTAAAQEEAPEPGPRAHLRIVNAALDPAGEPTALDVRGGSRADGPMLVAGLDSGTASEWLEVAAGRTTLLVLRSGKSAEADALGDQSVRLDEGDSAVVLIARGAPGMEGQPAVAFKVYVDAQLAEPPPDRAVLVGDVLAMQTVEGPGPNTFELGKPKQGCLRKLLDEDRNSPISGTFAVPYVVAPAASEVAAYRASDTGCRGAPASAMASLAPVAGERWLVFVHPGAKGAIGVLPVRSRFVAAPAAPAAP